MQYAKLIPASCAALICAAALVAPSVAAGSHERVAETPRFPIDLLELRAAETDGFNAADADGDGGVDVDEFVKNGLSQLTAARRTLAVRGGPKAGGKRGKHGKRRSATEADLGKRRAGEFAAADTDADGQLSADEYQQLPEAVRAERARRVFERWDADANGTLTTDEFPSMATRLERLDANGDGKITRDEMSRRRRR